ncbi:hypothetical protein EYF80_002852 [Liparis tanakae]|uniref:CARD domain-containing protein n=1 Tax=Liparis tanakae TaxID=230148 RepID=A0A4Z2JAN7_9TELE|nr:hypothetical protein EYF80_002852 [Liparis tanakae]
MENTSYYSRDHGSFTLGTPWCSHTTHLASSTPGRGGGHRLDKEQLNIRDSDNNKARLEETCGAAASLTPNMHLLSFRNCIDRVVEEALVGPLNSKMFGSGSKKWFVKKQKRHQHRSGRRPCTRKKKRWASKILKRHRQQILSELDVSAVLPYLVYDKVFTLGEYKEILGHESSKKRTEVFLDHLSSKGPAAFCSFCSVLEEECPHLLTSFLLDAKDGAPRQARNGGLPVPPNSPGEQPLSSPPTYTGPVFDSRCGNNLGVCSSWRTASVFAFHLPGLHTFSDPQQKSR